MNKPYKLPPQLKNQGKKLKVNQPINYLIPPYSKTSTEEVKKCKDSKQLSILPVLQQTPKQLLQNLDVQKPKQVRTKPTTKTFPKQK